MALMFPRLARNFAKNGYYPTDEPTLERALNALMPSDGPMCILDPCAGEGVAIAEAAYALGRDQAKAFAVEFDAERARHARGLVDHCLHADLMDTMVSKQSFGCSGSTRRMATCPRTSTATSAIKVRDVPASKSCSISVRCRCCSTAACWSSSSPATCSTRSWLVG
ncbi:O-methyl transferase family protein [Pseudomonas aeruginosa]|nr:O-methyl transferase family protein [Pseudomonas aeruginosa]